MAPVEGLLESGERVVHRTRLHPATFAGALGFAAFVLLWVALLIHNNDLSRGTEAQIALGGLAVIAMGALVPLLRWQRTEFAVTDRRLLVSAGAFRLRQFSIPLERERLDVERERRGPGKPHGTLLVVEEDGSTQSFAHVSAPRDLIAAVSEVRRRRPEPRPPRA